MERRDFDKVLKDYFPGAVTSRQEFRSGWIDTIEIGNILVEIAALHTTVRGSPRKKGIYAYIKARSDTKGECLIWSGHDRPCNVGALSAVLKALKKNLMGMAAAITQMCGFVEDIDIKEENLDVDEFINEPSTQSEAERLVEKLLGIDDDEIETSTEDDFDSFILD